MSRPRSNKNITNPKPCTIPGCNGKYEAKGLCQLHYDRFLTTGTTDLLPREAWNKGTKEIIALYDDVNYEPYNWELF